MKKILITGAGGFIGSHLTERLAELGYNLKAFLKYNSNNNWGWLEHSKIKKDIEVICGDIRDFDSVSKAMKGCDTVFHLAALIGIPYSYVSPLAYIQTNIIGSYNVLESAKQLNFENILLTSTSEIYGTAQYVPIDENHPAVGQSPYSATKIAADNLALSYFRSFDTPVKIVRPFNTYGPRQSARAILPAVIAQVLQGKKNVEVGNTRPTRDLTFVKDTVEGFVEIAKTKSFVGEVVNIGMNEEISIEDLIYKVSEIMNVKIRVRENKDRIRPETSEVFQLKCDNSKILSRSKWRPKFNLESGLQETIDWFKQNKALYKSEIYNI